MVIFVVANAVVGSNSGSSSANITVVIIVATGGGDEAEHDIDGSGHELPEADVALQIRYM